MISLPVMAAPGSPNQQLTRAELASDLMSALKLTPASNGPWFRDVSAQNPAAAAIETVSGDGLMQGVSTFRFDPGQPATRLDLARALVAGLGLQDTANSMTQPPPVSDVSNIPRADYGIVDIAPQLNLVPAETNGAFDPGGGGDQCFVEPCRPGRTGRHSV